MIVSLSASGGSVRSAFQRSNPMPASPSLPAMSSKALESKTTLPGSCSGYTVSRLMLLPLGTCSFLPRQCRKSNQYLVEIVRARMLAGWQAALAANLHGLHAGRRRRIHLRDAVREEQNLVRRQADGL